MDKKLIEKIREIAKKIKRNIKIMEICGSHTRVILKYGIKDVLPENVKLVSGPGCPVCVTSQRDIDCLVEMALQGVKIATYGDIFRVPGTKMSLERAREEGAEIKEIYSTYEILNESGFVFFGIGFETTAPMTTMLLKNKVEVFSSHKLIPPAMKELLKGEIKIDGFLNPGHVSTIIGLNAYKKIKAPQVITGFTAERVLRGIYLLLKLIKQNRKEVINGYPEVVTNFGNEIAKSEIKKYFKVCNAEWRGIGNIKNSGLDVKDKKLNAKVIYEEIIKDVKTKEFKGCRCGNVLKGLIEPPECKLFKKVCTPKNPKGACMVSHEGACAIYYETWKERE